MRAASRSIAESVVRPLSEGGIREVGAWHGAREIAFRGAWMRSCIRSMAPEIMSTEHPGQLRRPGNGGLAGGRQDLAAGSPKARAKTLWRHPQRVQVDEPTPTIRICCNNPTD